MRVILLLLAGLLTLLDASAFARAEAAAPAAQSVPEIAARAGVHPGFDRVVFDWPRTVAYKLTVKDGIATLDFAADARVKFNTGMFAYLTRASGFRSAIGEDGHLAVSFAVDPAASVKDFVSDHSVVIDIEGLPAPHQPVILANTPSAAPAAPPTPPAVAPVATPMPAPPVPPAVDKPALAVAPPPLAPPIPVALQTPIAAPIIGAQAPKAALTTAAPPPPVPGKAGLPELTDKPLLIASLDPHTLLGAVIYQRGGYGYIVFGGKLTLDLAALTSGQPPALVALEPLDLPKATGFRFTLPPNISLHATREGTAWRLYLARQQPEIPVSNTLIAQPDFALGARYLLPLSDSPAAIPFTDPVVGDDLVLVPLQQTEAFSVSRHMGDFRILPAAQGLVILPLIDKLAVRPVSDGLEITAEGGLHMSSATDTGAALESNQRLKAVAAGKSIFAFSSWYGRPDETFTQTRQRLQQTVVDVPEAERDRVRFELARFYFAHGYGEESLALLQWLGKRVPDMLAHPDFLALLGAANIVAARPTEGLQYLEMPALANQPEIALWRAVAHAELRDWNNAAPEFESVTALLDSYPEPFYSRFMILAIESELAVGNDHTAATLLDKIEAAPHADSVKAAILYLRGAVYAKAGRANLAEQSWKDAAALPDRLYKIRAELALIDLGVSTKSLTYAQAADRLEALRFGWRGDDLEIDILKRLGEFYIQAHDLRSGINVLGHAAQLYPDSPMTPAIREEMQHVFHDLFLGALSNTISPLDSLALYQQYRDLMPSGKEGDAVIRNLAEHLVAVDLLDQAAGLLDELVKTRLQGEEKLRVGTRLAAIWLLDHKPDQAMAALTAGDGQTMPADLQEERLLLRARALSEQNHNDAALALLQGDTQQNAKLLRADITMHAQHWGDAAKALMDLVGPPPAADVKLRHEQAQWLVNAAIAYALAGDQTGLDKLAIDYGAAMSDMPEKDTFQILTQPEKTAQLQDIAAARAKIAEVDLFQNFLNSYRKETGGDAAPTPAPASK